MKEPTDNLATTSNEILPTQLKKNIKKDQQVLLITSDKN